MKNRVVAVGVVVGLLLSGSAFADTLRIWRDCSSSMSENELQAWVPGLVAAIQQQSRITRVEIVRFSCKASRISSAGVAAFDIPGIPARQAPVPSGMLADWFVVGVHAADGAAERTYDNLLKTHAVERRAAGRAIEASLLERPTGSAECTRFDALAERMTAEELPYNLVITDGWLDCPIKAPILPKMSGRVLIVLLPRSVDPVVAEREIFVERSSELRPYFPDARIVPPYGAFSLIAALGR